MKVVKLIYVESDSNKNKYYNMIQQSDTEWIAEYGRVGETSQKRIYSMYQWDKKYREKIEKGYTDVTGMATIQTISSYADIKDAKVAQLISYLQGISNKSFADNYNVSASSITDAQLKAAQLWLNEIFDLYNKKDDYRKINKELERLYITIPRKMRKVADFMAKPLDTEENISFLSSLLQKEQDTLDNASVTSQLSIVNSDETILDKLGIEIYSEVDSLEMLMLNQLLGHNANRLVEAYKLFKPESEEKYKRWKPLENNRNESVLFHGTRTVNVLSIFSKSLLIRPSNAVHNGSAFGDGIYFANESDKSLNYTSINGSYWANGNTQYGFLFVYDVARGKTLELTSRHHGKYPPDGYDSVWAKKGMGYNYSWYLQNDEIIVYNSSQATPKYLLKIR